MNASAPIPVIKVRNMRGRCQSILAADAAGNGYIVKSSQPHARVRFNEWLATGLLSRAGVECPSVHCVECQESIPGLGVGSAVPVRMEQSIYDFLPDALLDKVVNADDFIGALIVDLWTGNPERQSVFYRDAVDRSSFRVTMIDHEQAFGETTIPSAMPADRTGLYFRKQVYQTVSGWTDLEPWMERTRSITESSILACVEAMPAQWHEPHHVDDIISDLIVRQRSLPHLVLGLRHSQHDPFGGWTNSSHSVPMEIAPA